MTVVREFHEAFGLPAPTSPTAQDAATIRLRMRLINEEAEEVINELNNLIYARDFGASDEVLRRLLKELADLRYVVEGAAVTFGLPIDDAYEEVHRSNMSKLGEDGKPVYRHDNKVLKGPNYREPDMEQFIPQIIEGEAEDDPAHTD